MTDERTPGLALALPHRGNKLLEDVLRLREALAAVDAAYAALQEVVAASVSQADHAAAVAQLQGAINNLSTTVSFMSGSKVGAVNGRPGPAVTLRPSDLQGNAMSVARDGQGRVSTVERTVAGKTETTVITRDGQGRVQAVAITYDGKTRTETYTRNGVGQIAGMTATETNNVP